MFLVYFSFENHVSLTVQTLESLLNIENSYLERIIIVVGSSEHQTVFFSVEVKQRKSKLFLTSALSFYIQLGGRGAKGYFWVNRIGKLIGKCEKIPGHEIFNLKNYLVSDILGVCINTVFKDSQILISKQALLKIQDLLKH